MSTIISFFTRNWKFSLIMTLFLVLAGIMGLRSLKRESFPPVNFAMVRIHTVYIGASPEEVHDQVTRYIEDELRGIDGIKDVRSTSQNDLSEITVRIDIDRSDTQKIVDDIQRAVQRASAKLPEEITEDPVITEIKAKEIPVLELALIGPNINRQRERLADQLEKSIEDVKGVSRVNLIGYSDRELQVLLDPHKMIDWHVGLSDILHVIQSQIANVPSGYIDDHNEFRLVRVMGKTKNPDTLSELVIRSNVGENKVLLKDIARVEEGGERPKVITSVNGEPATLLSTTKQSEADALTVVNEVKKVISHFEKTLPKNYKITIYNDEGQRIENRLNIVEFNAITGLIIVLLVLFMLLPGKIGLISALSLPLCSLACVVFMNAFGANFNIITMIALVICLGNLVDNSVVVSEHYTSLREKDVPATKAAIDSATQFWIPFTASTVTIVSAFLPMLVTSGVMGQFIMWIPIIVAIALVLSLIEALTLLPARLQFIDPKKKSAKKKSVFDLFESTFTKLIAKTIRHKYVTMISLTAILLSGIVITVLFNRFELFPSEGVEYYIGRYELDPQSSLYKTDLMGREISKMVREKLTDKVLTAVTSHAGVQEVDPTDPRSRRGENIGLIVVAIRPDVYADLDINQTLSQLNSLQKPNDVLKLSFEAIDQGPPIGKPLTVTLRSTDYKQLNAFRDEFMNELSKIVGLENLDDDESSTGEEYRFHADLNMTKILNLDAASIGSHFRTALQGYEVVKLNENQKEYNLVVKYAPEFTTSADNFDKYKIINSEGKMTKLNNLGSLSTHPSPKIRKNYNYQRSITITSEVDVNTITSQQANAKARNIAKSVSSRYPDVSMVFGGEEESTNESLNTLGLALLLAIFGIFATLVFTFNSFSEPLLILSTIPLGMIGVFYGFAIDQRPLSFLAFIGIVGLSGVVINSAIILVDYIKELRQTHASLPLNDILLKASSERFRAVIATGLTTVVGLIPTAFGLGGYDPVLVPITFALSWGMIVGTLLSLLWIPSAVLLLEDVKRLFRK